MTQDNNGTVVITGAEDTEAASRIALRGALRMEARGMKRHGRSARVIANEVMGTKYGTARKAYEAFDKWLTAKYPGRVDSYPLS